MASEFQQVVTVDGTSTTPPVSGRHTSEAAFAIPRLQKAAATSSPQARLKIESFPAHLGVIGLSEPHTSAVPSSTISR